MFYPLACYRSAEQRFQEKRAEGADICSAERTISINIITKELSSVTINRCTVSMGVLAHPLD